MDSDPRTVFVSYRRQLGAYATLIYKDLQAHDFDAFMDVRNLDSGEFNPVILRQIETRAHFVVVLVPGSLDRIGQEGDWLRREIAQALTHDRNVVPVTADGFKFGDVLLPPDVARLPNLNAVSIPREFEYFESAMTRLRTKFLNEPVELSAPAAEYEPHVPRGSPLPTPALAGRRHSGNPMRVHLAWSKIPSAEGYVLERKRDRDFREVYRGPDRVYEDAPAASTTSASWWYRVRAVRSLGRGSKWSDELWLTTGF